MRGDLDAYLFIVPMSVIMGVELFVSKWYWRSLGFLRNDTTENERRRNGLPGLYGYHG